MGYCKGVYNMAKRHPAAAISQNQNGREVIEEPDVLLLLEELDELVEEPVAEEPEELVGEAAGLEGEPVGEVLDDDSAAVEVDVELGVDADDVDEPEVVVG